MKLSRLLYTLAFLAFLPPALSTASGCGSGGGRAYSADLTDNYLPAVAPAAWYQGVVTYRIEGGDSQIPFVDLPRAAEQGIRDWDGVPSSAQFRRAGDGEPADILVGFGTKADTLGANGRTFPDVDDTRTPGAYRSCRVVLLRSLPPFRIRQTMAHEWGHAARGIRGHSDSARDLMAATVPLTSRPTQRDYSTALLIAQMLGGG